MFCLILTSITEPCSHLVCAYFCFLAPSPCLRVCVCVCGPGFTNLPSVVCVQRSVCVCVCVCVCVSWLKQHFLTLRAHPFPNPYVNSCLLQPKAEPSQESLWCNSMAILYIYKQFGWLAGWDLCPSLSVWEPPHRLCLLCCPVSNPVLLCVCVCVCVCYGSLELLPSCIPDITNIRDIYIKDLCVRVCVCVWGNVQAVCLWEFTDCCQPGPDVHLKAAGWFISMGWYHLSIPLWGSLYTHPH